MLEKTIHRTGLTILSYYNPLLPSFALSYTLKQGSRAETKENSGINHFIEHMLFKGTEKYNLKDIAQISDRLGGSLNAYTGKETTQFYIKAIDEKFDSAFNLLSDMVLNSVFPEDEFYKEKNVILQELKESSDNPDSHSFEIFYENFFLDNSLGLPIGGTETSVSLMKRETVYKYYKNHYKPSNLILTVSGNIKHKTILRAVDELFEDFSNNEVLSIDFKQINMNFSPIINIRDLKQLYVIIGFKGLPSNSPLRYSFMVANDILGSGMSSRLFQKVREEKGLAYTINSFPDSFIEDGILMIHSIIAPENIERYFKAISNELSKLVKNGITDDELERSKDHIKSSAILGLENNTTRMQFLVNQEIYNREKIEIKDIIRKIENLKKENINNIFSSILNFNKNTFLCYGDTKTDISNIKLSV